MSRRDFYIGALVRKKNGMPGRFMILTLLSNNRAHICPEDGEVSPVENVYLADLKPDEMEGKNE